MSEHAIELGDVIEVLRDYGDNVFDAVLCDPPYGLSFMGRKWDYDVPTTALCAEVFRVLKPGAPLIAFGGTRTYHRLVVNIEDAGFEIRDQLTWLYGSGFPKSLNVGKALDEAGADLVKQENLWDGYGTALKPAVEPAVLARKPLEGTVVQNVTKWGVGALAIDACRIGSGGGGTKCTNRDEKGKCRGHQNAGRSTSGETFHGPDTDGGRWPANVILDEAAGALLDAQTGNRPSTLTGRADPNKKHANNSDNDGASWFGAGASGVYADSGGASRFFYCAKASRSERDAGCEDLPATTGGEATDREDDSPGTRSPQAGAGRTGGARNHHPTVKPIALMTYLARLLLPPRPGAILVPFSGSGSEMIGALKAGWPAVVGIERENAYVEIARRRVAHHVKAA